MFTFILILLLLAAVFGVLGAVLKIALILALSVILAVALLAWGGWLWFRGRMRAFEREVNQWQRRDRSVDVRHVENEVDRDPPELDR